ncbi:MAG: hypothetical protein ABSA10_05720 [Anaerolineales bacterium]|jgi:hypothetical protein
MKKTIALLLFAGWLLAACGTAPAPVATQTAAPSESSPTAEPANHAADVQVAAKMAGLLFDLETVQKNLDDDTTAMAKVTVGAADTVSFDPGLGFSGKRAAPVARPLVQISKVPQGFLDPLPENGAIPGEAGSCGAAAANPAVTFMTVGGVAVTPQLLADKKLQTLPTDMVTRSQSDPKSLFALINTLVKNGDPRLGTAQGWDTLLWDQLKTRQTSAESLMDYQLWNASPDIEQEVADLYGAQLRQMGLPSVVLDAYNASHKTGWYASSLPAPDDALAQMNIEAQMAGSIEGTVHERREFTITGAEQTPQYGVQTGEGTVTWDAPGLGVLTFDVNIRLDKFDDRGHAVGGTVVGIDPDKGYTVNMTFLPDGTRKGEILRYGKPVGELSMSVDEDKFQNFLDVSTNQTEPLPNP